MPTIAPNANIKELVAEFPIAAEVLERFGLGCPGCGVSGYETIEQGARAHGLRTLGDGVSSGHLDQTAHRTPVLEFDGDLDGYGPRP